MRLHKVAHLHRKELIALLRLVAAEEVFPYQGASHDNLVELVYSALGYMFVGEPMEYTELETEYYRRISRILNLQESPEDLDLWDERCAQALGQRVLAELMPILEVAHSMSWADGNFVSEELEVYDLVFSQLKLLRPFKSSIVELCLNPIPAATVKADLAPFSENRDKAKCVLSFAWAIAMVDADTHENEIRLFDEMGEVLNFSPQEKRDVQAYVENRWNYLKTKEKIERSAQLVVFSSGIDDYIRRVVGFDAFHIISQVSSMQRKNPLDAGKSIADTFNSLTLFSKMSLISGPQLTLIDRIVLVLGLVLSEIAD